MLFKDNDSILYVFAISSGESCSIFSEVPHPDKFKKKGVIAIKLSEEGLTPANITQNLVFLEMTRNVLDHLYLVFNDILSPILQNPAN